MDIPKEKLLDNSDLYEIPEDRRQAIIDAPENDRRETSQDELDEAMTEATGLFTKWTESVGPDSSEGDKTILEGIQEIIERVDRVLSFKYTDTLGKSRQMIFKPSRLHNLDKTTLENRLELQ